MICCAEWTKEYLDYCKKRYVEKTYKEKKSVFRRFFKDFDATMSVEELSFENVKILKFFQKQMENRSGCAANKDRKNLLAAWNWGVKYLKLPSLNPFKVEKMPEKRTPRYIPPENDFWEVYNLTKGQDRIMFLAYLHLAARRSELFNLKWSDVDFENHRVRLWTRKRKDGTLEPDWLPMTKSLSRAFSQWKHEIPIKGKDHVFICLDEFSFCKDVYGEPFKTRQHFMGKLCKKAKVKKFGFHAIRHFTASSLYKSGCDLSEIQAILRHKSPSTTVGYLRSIGIEKVRSSLEKFSSQHMDKITGDQENLKRDEIKKAV
jgi:integrase